MKITEIITEGTNHPLIIVDVQPAYEHAISFESELMEFLNHRSGKVWIMYNGNEHDAYTDDDEYEVKHWYIDYGLDEYKLDNFRWTDKGYGFLRNWMDMGVSDSAIIKCIREMFSQRVHDSRELFDGDIEQQQEFFGNDWDDGMADENIHVNEWLVPAQLKEYSGAYLCGGGEHECLREVMLWMSAFNIKYKLLERFIY